MRRLKYPLIYLIVSFQFFSPVSAEIEKIPLEDYQKLETFFDYLMHYSEIGYSLCGEKPVSIENFPGFSKFPPKYAVKLLNHPIYSILCTGWEHWSRFAHLFPSENFVFRYVPTYGTLVFINKRATRKVIADNLDLFQKYSHSSQSVEEFLDEICYPKDREYLSGYNITLLGILLGFGRNNAIAFSQNSFIQKLETFRLYETENALNAFTNPGFFMINNGTNEEENSRIKRSFRIAKKNIQLSFEDGHYLETFVKCFTQK